MKRIEYAAIAWMASAVLIGAPLAQADETTEPMRPPSGPMSPTQPTDEQTQPEQTQPMIDSPASPFQGRTSGSMSSPLVQRFGQARDLLEQNNHAGAANEIRGAQRWLIAQGGQEEGDVTDSLNDAAEDLNGLAERVEKKEVKSAPELTKEFAGIQKNVAKSYVEAASDKYDDEDFAGAGRALTAAATHLEQAARVSNVTLQGSALQSVAGAREIAGGLERGTRPEAKSVEQSIDGLRAAIDEFEPALQPERSEPAASPLVN